MKRALFMLLMISLLGSSIATSEASAAARQRSGVFFNRTYNGAQYNMPNRQGGYGYYSFGFRGFPFGYSSGAFSGNNRN